MIFTQRCTTMCGPRLCLLVFLFLSFANGAGAVECYWCSGVGKDRQCELSPRNVSTGPVSTKCSMRYCISTKVMDGATGEVQSFARHCDHIPHGNVCVKDSRLITCFETCTSDLCNSGNPDPSYLRTQEYSFTYLGLPGLGSALYRSEDKDLLYNDGLDIKSETKQYKDFVAKSSKVPSLESLKIVAYKSKEDRDGGSGQRENKVTRPWKWWEMTRGIRRRKGYTGTVTRDKTQQVTMDTKQQSVVDHEVTRPASRVESKIAVNSVKPVPSSVKATENQDKATRYLDDRDKAGNFKLNYKGDKHSKGDNKKFSQRHSEGDSRHTFDYIGYHPLSKKKQSKLDSEKKPMNMYHEFEKMSNTVPGSLDALKNTQAVRNRDIQSVQSNLEILQSDKDLSKVRPSQETFPSESIDSRNKIEQDGFEQGITNSAQGNIISAQGNIKSALGNIQTAQDGDRISRNNGNNLNDQLLYINGISRNYQVNQKSLLKDEQLNQDLTTLRSLSPEYSDLTEDELELLPLFEALISDEELAKHFQTLFIDDETGKETVKETGSQMQNKFPTVRPTYGLLETANIYSSQRDFSGALGTRSPTLELLDDFRKGEQVGHHGGVTKFRKVDQQFENDFIPQPFKIRSLEIKNKMINAKDKENFDKTNFSTTASSVKSSSTLSKNLANIDQNKQDSSLPPFFLKLDNGEGSIYNTENKTLNPYEINEVTSKVISSGTDTAKPKRAFLEMDRFRSPSDSSSGLSPNHNNLKTRSPYWVSEAHGKRVTIHTGKIKQPQMPLEMNALKFAKPGLMTTVLNTQNALETSQTPLRKNMFSSIGEMNVNIENNPNDVVTNDKIIQPYSSPKSSQQRRELVDRLKDEKIYHINNALTEKSESVFPSGKDKSDKRDNYKEVFQGHGHLVNSKNVFNKTRVHFDKRSGTDIRETSLTSDHRSDTPTIRETTLTPHPITFDSRLTKRYPNDNDFLTSINLKLGKPKSDSKFLPSMQVDKDKAVTPRSDTYRTTLFAGQVNRVDNETYTEDGRKEKADKISKSISATTVTTLNDTSSRSLSDTVNSPLSSTVSRSLSSTVSRSPTEEVQIATPNPYFSVTESENLKREIPDKQIAIDKRVQSKTDDVLAHTASRNSTVKTDNRFGNNIQKNERKHSTDSAQFRTSGVDKDYTFKASVFVTSATRSTPEAITFPQESSGKVIHLVPVARSMKDKNKKSKNSVLSAIGNPVHPQTLPQETWITTNVLPSDTFKTSFNSLESSPNELFQSKMSSTEQYSRAEASSVRKESLTHHTPLQYDTPSVNNEDRYVLEAYKDTLKELSQNSDTSYKHALKSRLSDTTMRAPTHTVFVTPRVHRMGRLEKLEGGRRMFSFNRENFSSSVHHENTRLCVFTVVLMAMIALI